jgi:hypothetical protein
VATANVIYSNTFSAAIGPEWSIARSSTTPNQPAKYGGFLGQFSGDESVVLNLTDLTAGEYSLAFDLFIIRSWDGTEKFLNRPPDLWSVGLDGQMPWLLTSFSNTLNSQTYPLAFSPGSFNSGATPAAARYSGTTNGARFDADEVNSLGFLYPGVGVNDAVYRQAFNFTVGPGSAAIRFSGQGLEGLADESWGIDNVVVSRVPEPSGAFLAASAGVGWLVHAFLRRRRS